MSGKNSRLNRIYNGIKTRCYNKKRSAYKNYGERGIMICQEWASHNTGWQSFKKWAMANGYKDDLTIDRIDNNKGYSPDNCRWVTRLVQGNNTRRNHYVKYNNTVKTLSEWCRELELNYDRTEQRINKLKWTVERAFTTKGRVR